MEPSKLKNLRKFHNFSRTLKCQCRNSSLPRFFARYVFLIHNGKSFIKTKSKRLSIGYKLGEFAYTRKAFYYPMRKKIKPRK